MSPTYWKMKNRGNLRQFMCYRTEKIEKLATDANKRLESYA